MFRSGNEPYRRTSASALLPLEDSDVHLVSPARWQYVLQLVQLDGTISSIPARARSTLSNLAPSPGRALANVVRLNSALDSGVADGDWIISEPRPLPSVGASRSQLVSSLVQPSSLSTPATRGQIGTVAASIPIPCLTDSFSKDFPRIERALTMRAQRLGRPTVQSSVQPACSAVQVTDENRTVADPNGRLSSRLASGASPVALSTHGRFKRDGLSSGPNGKPRTRVDAARLVLVAERLLQQYLVNGLDCDCQQVWWKAK